MTTTTTLTAPYPLSGRHGGAEYINGRSSVDASTPAGMAAAEYAMRRGWTVDPALPPRPPKPTPAEQTTPPTVPAEVLAKVSRAAQDAADALAAAAAARAEAQAADDRAANAQQMVRNRDPRLDQAVTAASSMQDILAASDRVHASLEQQITGITLTPGKDGRDGIDGRNGRDGADSTVPGKAGRDGIDGKDGAASTIPGKDGTNGKDSTVPGPPGASAFDVARANGFTGTPAQWVASLKGEPGNSGMQIEYRDGVAVPAIGSLLGSVGTVDVTVTWPTPFPDANYLVTAQLSTSAATLIGKTTVVVKSRTAAAVVLTVSTTALVSVGQATVSAVAYRKPTA